MTTPNQDTKQTKFEKELSIIYNKNFEKDKHPLSGLLFMSSKAGFENNGEYDDFKNDIFNEVNTAHTAALREKEREVLNNVMGTVEMSKANVGEQPDKGLHYILLIEDKINNRLTQLKDEENKKGIL